MDSEAGGSIDPTPHGLSLSKEEWTATLAEMRQSVVYPRRSRPMTAMAVKTRGEKGAPTLEPAPNTSPINC